MKDFKEKTKLGFSLLTLLVSILVFSYATIAWLSINRDTSSQNQGMKFQTVSDITTIDCWALKYDGLYGAVCYEINGETDLVMTEYDQVFLDRNVNTPLIFALRLSNISNKTGDYLSIKIPCSEGYISGNYSGNINGNRASNFISNVMEARVNCSGDIVDPIPTTERREESNVNLFKTQINQFAGIEGGSKYDKFVEVDPSGSAHAYTKKDSIELRLDQSEYRNSVFLDETGAYSIILYIEIDYSDELMDAYINYSNEELSQNAYFESDIGTIQIMAGNSAQ